MPGGTANKLDINKDKISTVRSSLSSPGILKSHLEERKPSNTVKFSRKDQVRIIGPVTENNKGERKGSGNPRRKPSGNVQKQSRELLRRINQERESESEGYHSDCMSPNVLKKNSRHKSSLERRKKYSNNKQRRDPQGKGNFEQSTSSSSASSSRDNPGLSKTNSNAEGTGSTKSVVIRKETFSPEIS